MRSVRTTVFVSGIAAVIMQTLLIREGLVLFGGYELVTGMLFCFWLLWGGVGSIFAAKVRNPEFACKRYAILLLLLCIFGVLSLIGMRYAPIVFSLPFGEVISVENMLFISCIMLAPVCLIFGMLFPTAVHMLAPERVYLLEGIGAFFGGILITFVLLPLVPPFGILLLVVFTLSLCIFLMLDKKKLMVISIALLILFFYIIEIETFFRQIQMPGQDLIAVRDSRYGLISVTRSPSQINFFSNGVYDFSYPDEYSTEEAVHYPLLLHPAPENVLLVGGGIASCINQILKHPTISNVTYVELDPLIIQMGKKYVPEEHRHDPRLNVILGDGRLYVKHTKKVFDVVIINLPDPINAQLNRFYTTEFFSELRRIIQQNGIMSIRIATPPDIISPSFGQLLNTVYISLNESFPHLLALPAGKTTFIASRYPIDRVHLIEILKERTIERDLHLLYVNEYYFEHNLRAEKIAYLNEQILQSSGRLNTDIRPVSYYFTTLLWGGVVTGALKALLLWLFNIHPLFFLLPVLCVLPFFRRRSLIYVSVYAVGASEISAELILIVLFQVLYGYLYGWIGAIIAFYMLGLTSGTWFYLRSLFIRHARVRTLSSVQFAMVGYLLLIALTALFRPPGVYLFVPVLVFLGGFLGGLHFPLSVGVMKRRSAGVIYGIDLIGSGSGALVTAVIFIPVIGIVYTLLLLIVLNGIVGIGLRTLK